MTLRWWLVVAALTACAFVAFAVAWKERGVSWFRRRLIERLDAHPGDTVVVKVAGRLTHDRATAIKATVASCVPEDVMVLVTDESIDLTVVRRVA